ncbi:hypothetical protein D3C86_1542870 [compost metagenome]
MQFHTAGARTPAHVVAVVLDVTHALDANDHDGLGMAGLDAHRGIGHGLQTGTTTTIDRIAGHFYRQVGQQSGVTAHARGFAVGIRLGNDDFIQRVRGDIQPLHQRSNNGRRQVVGSQ